MSELNVQGRRLTVPSLVGYSPLVLIGRGESASVYRSHDLRSDRRVAIKIMDVGELSPATLRRFERECKAVGSLSSHPNIVTIHSGGRTSDGKPYLVMDLAEGGSLAARLRRHRPVRAVEVISLGRELLTALGAAHEIGILHRDITPGTVLFSRDGRPQLADFAISSIPGGHRTGPGNVTAATAFAAPEVMKGRPAEKATDLYSIAAVLAALIIGRPVFTRGSTETATAYVYRILRDPPRSLEPYGASRELSDVLHKGMAKAPSGRYPSAAAFLEALAGVPEAASATPAAENDLVEATADATVDMTGDATVEATADDSVEATSDDSVEASGADSVDATGDDSVDATGDDSVDATGDDSVEATGDDSVDATGDDSVEATGDDSVDATGDDSVEATGDDSVEATSDDLVADLVAVADLATEDDLVGEDDLAPGDDLAPADVAAATDVRPAAMADSPIVPVATLPPVDVARRHRHRHRQRHQRRKLILISTAAVLVVLATIATLALWPGASHPKAAVEPSPRHSPVADVSSGPDPVAALRAPSFTSSCTGRRCTFTSGETDIRTGEMLTWQFGDGTTRSGPAQVSHRYGAAGTYTAALIAGRRGKSATSKSVAISITSWPRSLHLRAGRAGSLKVTVTVSGLARCRPASYSLERRGATWQRVRSGRITSSVTTVRVPGASTYRLDLAETDRQGGFCPAAQSNPVTVRAVDDTPPPTATSTDVPPPATATTTAPRSTSPSPRHTPPPVKYTPPPVN